MKVKNHYKSAEDGKILPRNFMTTKQRKKREKVPGLRGVVFDRGCPNRQLLLAKHLIQEVQEFCRGEGFEEESTDG